MEIRHVLDAKGGCVEAVRPSDGIRSVVRRFANSKMRCLAVTEDGAIVGVLTIRDVLAHIDQRGVGALEGKVEHAMTHDITTVTPDTSLEDAAALFGEKRFNHLPVVEGGSLVGIVTPADVFGRHLRDAQEGSELLRDYIAGVYF